MREYETNMSMADLIDHLHGKKREVVKLRRSLNSMREVMLEDNSPLDIGLNNTLKALKELLKLIEDRLESRSTSHLAR